MIEHATEIEYQDKIAGYARLQGWLTFHPRRSQTGGKWSTAVSYEGVGFFDLVCIHPRGYQMMLEVKSANGVVSSDQSIWQEAALAVEAAINNPRYIVAVVYPKDWGWVQRFIEAPRREPCQVNT